MFAFAGKRATCAVLGSVAGASYFLGESRQQRYAFAHCQVPCGIYDDSGRIKAMKENVATITKAMASIQKPADTPQALNQHVRWINTKEDHATKIITTVSEYFLTQKLKDVPSDSSDYQKYLEALALHHKVMRLAMKTKQSTDDKTAKDLAHAVDHLAVYYGN